MLQYARKDEKVNKPSRLTFPTPLPHPQPLSQCTGEGRETDIELGCLALVTNARAQLAWSLLPFGQKLTGLVKTELVK